MVAQPTLAVSDPPPAVPDPALAVPDPPPVVPDPALAVLVVLDPALEVLVVVDAVIPVVVEAEEEEEALAPTPAVGFADLLLVVQEIVVQFPGHLLVVLFLRSATPQQARPL